MWLEKWPNTSWFSVSLVPSQLVLDFLLLGAENPAKLAL